MATLSDALKGIEITDKRAASGYIKPKVERHGNVGSFIPARDRILVKRLAPITEEGLIVRPEVTVELSERGHVVAVGACEYGAPPIGVVACFSKYGSEEKRFDDDGGSNTYALVWIDDVRGWDNA